MMRYVLFMAILCLGAQRIYAEEPVTDDYAEPALCSSVVAIEFTGQRCRYCPDMARGLEDYQKQFGKEHYILAALHNLTDYSLLPNGQVSLYHPEADAYGQAMDVPYGLPHVYYNSLGPVVDSLVLFDMFKRPDLLECVGKVSVTDDYHYQISLKTRLRSDRRQFMEGRKIDLLVWALEDDIVAIQDDNGRWTYPAHQHIFRGQVNGFWGELYEIGTAYERTLPIPDAVSVVGNTEVVVFFLDHESKAILDAASFEMEPMRVVTHPFPGDLGAFATFSASVSTTPSIEGVRAFYSTTVNADAMILKEIEQTDGKLVIPPFTGVLLQTEDSMTFSMTPCADALVPMDENNLLRHAALAPEVIPEETNAYVLLSDSLGIAFVKMSDSLRTVTPNRAYAVLPDDTKANRIGVAMGGQTDITDILVPSSTEQEPLYDLMGRRVQRPVSGTLYIQGKKKVVALPEK